MPFLDKRKSKFLDAKHEQERAKKQEARGIRKQEQAMNAALSGFIQRREHEAQRRKDATDSEYWVCICFANRADKDRFVKEFELDQCPLIPGTVGDKYVDGPALVERWLAPPEGNSTKE